MNAEIAAYNDANSSSEGRAALQIFKGVPCFSSDSETDSEAKTCKKIDESSSSACTTGSRDDLRQHIVIRSL